MKGVNLSYGRCENNRNPHHHSSIARVMLYFTYHGFEILANSVLLYGRFTSLGQTSMKGMRMMWKPYPL